ncbi:hypothetical protein HUG17_9443 [Dermatophagoides farinae]|uniref:NTR domain-containing protein n=1 Tax=Dermatophagoides farinae TaxID=6954 RepID=A0A9D4NUT0_DERFA|nr:hypothetical protein HUG17_9443 [Dermatophagoides farinae]
MAHTTTVVSDKHHKAFGGMPIRIIIIVILMTSITTPVIDACSCLMPDEPQYCSTDFFALLHITDEKSNEQSMSVDYHFEPISVISDEQRLLTTYKSLHTYGSSAACGVKLKPGERYLIGGNVDRYHGRLLLDLCRSYVEPYVRGLAVMTKDFHSLLQHCRSSDKTASVIDNVVAVDRETESITTDPTTFVTNHQLEREGKPIIRFPLLGLTEDDIRRLPPRRQQRKSHREP